MSELIRQEGRALTIHDYEARIAIYREQIGTGYIGIGRTLNEAKESRAVPHGEWESWVTRVTGLTPRQAQRCMQAAKEIREGSAMAQLEMSKALMLLSSGLEEDTREEIAARAVEEGATVKELKAAIEELKREKDRVNVERDQTVKELKLKLVNTTGSLEEAKVRLRKEEQRASAAEGQAKGFYDSLSRERAERRSAYDNGRADGHAAGLTEGRAEAMREFEKLSGEVDRLQAELDAAEKREEKRARQLEEMKAARQMEAMDSARSLNATGMNATDLGAAVRSFIGAAGVLPQMGSSLARMPKEDREAIREMVETVARWVEGARGALGTIHADGGAVQ